jgi:hypothetical protein
VDDLLDERRRDLEREEARERGWSGDEARTGRRQAAR